MSNFKFASLNYEQQRKDTQVELIATEQHPLVQQDETSSSGSKSAPDSSSVTVSEDVVDPLSMAAAIDDPLSQNVLIDKPQQTLPAKAEAKYLDETFEVWEIQKQRILQRFSTDQKLSIESSFLPGAVAPKQKNAVSEKMKNRLEQLDDFDDNTIQKEGGLSQEQYELRINQLRDQLVSAWGNEQRVKSLKIAIQCAKLLADRKVIQFYPAKFVLITDILDTFGRLVFDRIFEKSAVCPPGSGVKKMLPTNFKPEDVPPSSKEICRNWFYKIASIRELIPRLYVEASLLKCYSFLEASDYEDALKRLTASVCGIADPLVAAYARCYLSRIGIDVAPQLKTHLVPMFRDFVGTYDQITASFVKKQMMDQKLNDRSYIALFVPAVEWMLQCLAFKAPDDVLAEILKISGDKASSTLVLHAVMSAFSPDSISSRAEMFARMIASSNDGGLPRHQLFRVLGLNLVMSPPDSIDKLSLLNQVWNVVSKVDNPTEYMMCAEVWIEYPSKYLTKKEVNVLLGDIVKHMTADRAFEDHYGQLMSILEKLLSHMTSFEDLCSMDNFMALLDLFHNDQIKVQACKRILQAFGQNQIDDISDAVVTNGMMYVAKLLHDSISALTFEDEKRQISSLVVGFLSKVSFGRNFEHNLNFFVEARKNFCNLDNVLMFLVHGTNSLIMQTRAIVKGKHTKKTASFIRSCVAFNFITIPSITSTFDRLKLYCESATVAVVNQAVGQADGLLSAAMTLLSEAPTHLEVNNMKVSTDEQMKEVCLQLISTLLLIPDDPSKSPLPHYTQLVTAVDSFEWSGKSHQFEVYLGCISLLTALAQSKYLYSPPGVDTNDVLYGSATRFHDELRKHLQHIIDATQSYLSSLGTGGDGLRKQRSHMLDILLRLALCGNMKDAETSAYIARMWVAVKDKGADKIMLSKAADVLTSRSNRPGMVSLLEQCGIQSSVC